MRKMLFIIILLAGLVGAYSWWRSIDRDYDPPSSDFHIDYARSVGHDTGQGNLVAIQPYMVTGDYSSQTSFTAKLDAYFQAARDEGWFSAKTVVVLPEYLGSWLVVEGEKKQVYEATVIDDAMMWMALSNIVPFTCRATSGVAENRIEYALFSMKSQRMAQIYDSVLSSLAQKYGVTLVGGSIVLAAPTIIDGHLVSGDGPLYSVAPIYHPDGRADDQLVFKSRPMDVEQVFMRAKPVEELPVYQSPVGRLGVMICADSWFPEAYQVMRQKQADAVVVVSYINTLDEIWTGVSGYPNPADVDPGDLNRINLQQAWDKYAMAGRLPASGIPDGMLDCLRGKMWDLGFAGSTVLVRDGQVIKMPYADGATLVNSWL